MIAVIGHENLRPAVVTPAKCSASCTASDPELANFTSSIDATRLTIVSARSIWEYVLAAKAPRLTARVAALRLPAGRRVRAPGTNS